MQKSIKIRSESAVLQESVLQSAAIEIESLKNEIAKLNEQIVVLQEDYADLEVEAFEALQKTDGTPGALIFFSLLGEPKYIQNLQQLILQLQQLKGFASGNSHIDYLTLKKRVQVCVVSIPNIQKLLDKYFHLYEKWSLHRMNWFTERNRTGGSADAYTNCPLCYHDLLDSPNSEIRNQTLHLLKDTVEKDHQKKTLAMSKSMQSLSNTNNSSANNLQSSSPIIHGTINPKRSASPGGNSRNQLIKGRTLELNPVIRHSTPNL